LPLFILPNIAQAAIHLISLAPLFSTFVGTTAMVKSRILLDKYGVKNKVGRISTQALSFFAGGMGGNFFISALFALFMGTPPDEDEALTPQQKEDLKKFNAYMDRRARLSSTTPLLASNNPLGRGGIFPYIDITPFLVNLPLYGPYFNAGKNNATHSYIRFGKQFYEVKGWFTKPIETLIGKSSRSVRTLFEQMTGVSANNFDIAMPWKNQYNENSAFYERTKHVINSFTPFTWQTWANGGIFTHGPFTIAAPGSRSISKRKYTEGVEAELRRIAQNAERSNEKYLPRLVNKANTNNPYLIPYLEALKQQNVNTDAVLKQITGKLIKEYQSEFLLAVGSQDIQAANKAALAIYALGGTFDSTMKSMRQSRKGRTFTNKELDAFARKTKLDAKNTPGGQAVITSRTLNERDDRIRASQQKPPA